MLLFCIAPHKVIALPAIAIAIVIFVALLLYLKLIAKSNRTLFAIVIVGRVITLVRAIKIINIK